MDTQESTWLTLNEAADYLKIKKSFLYQLTSRKAIRYFKPTNKNIFFKREDLDAFMVSGEVKTDEQLRAETAKLLRG